jgi:hypothetical protein
MPPFAGLFDLPLDRPRQHIGVDCSVMPVLAGADVPLIIQASLLYNNVIDICHLGKSSAEFLGHQGSCSPVMASGMDAVSLVAVRYDAVIDGG